MVEKVEVVAWYCDRDGKTELTSGFVAENCAYVDRHKDCNWQECMTVAQHERIVSGLEARLREAEGLLRTVNEATFSRWQELPACVTDPMPAIDAFLAQTAEDSSG